MLPRSRERLSRLAEATESCDGRREASLGRFISRVLDPPASSTKSRWLHARGSTQDIASTVNRWVKCGGHGLTRPMVITRLARAQQSLTHSRPQRATRVSSYRSYCLAPVHRTAKIYRAAWEVLDLSPSQAALSTTNRNTHRGHGTTARKLEPQYGAMTGCVNEPAPWPG